MRTHKTLLCLLIIFTAFSLSSCDLILMVPKYIITFDTKGGTPISSTSANLISEFPISSKTGFALEGWFLDDSYSNNKKVSFPFSPSSNVTLTAKWVTGTEGLYYYDLIEGACSVSKGTSNTNGSIEIPEYWLGNRVIRIGDHAFDGCSNLENITLPNSVAFIGDFAFRNCSSLTNLTLPGDITVIQRNAFSACSSLSSINLPNSLTYIGESAFLACSSLTRIVVPNGITIIMSSTFNGCHGLTSIALPSKVTRIEDNAFSGCSSLTSISLPNSLSYIGNFTFRECNSLTSITLPSSVTSVGMYAFSCCANFKTAYINPEVPPSAGELVFNHSSLLSTIKVPATSVAAYKSTSGWSSYGSIIVAQ